MKWFQSILNVSEQVLELMKDAEVLIPNRYRVLRILIGSYLLKRFHEKAAVFLKKVFELLNS